MKKPMIKSVLFIATLASSSLAFASLKDLQGTWSVSERICTDGRPAQDRFVLGRDSVQITITGHRAQVAQHIGDETYLDSGTVAVKGRQLVTKMDNGELSSTAYVLSKKDQVIIFSAGFEQGGSCAQGEGLMTVLKKDKGL